MARFVRLVHLHIVERGVCALWVHLIPATYRDGTLSYTSTATLGLFCLHLAENSYVGRCLGSVGWV